MSSNSRSIPARRLQDTIDVLFSHHRMLGSPTELKRDKNKVTFGERGLCKNGSTEMRPLIIQDRILSPILESKEISTSQEFQPRAGQQVKKP